VKIIPWFLSRKRIAFSNLIIVKSIGIRVYNKNIHVLFNHSQRMILLLICSVGLVLLFSLQQRRDAVFTEMI